VRGGARPRRSLGQNFLQARWVARLFADWACRYTRLAEIGPGEGALTREVLARCPHVLLAGLELDHRLLDALSALRLLAPLGAEAVHADALHPPLRPGAVEAVYGSIPYNITGPLLGLLALSEPPPPAMLLLQKEVVDRLAAAPGTGAYGRITVLVQLAYRVEPGPVVPPSAFRPRPRVYSRIVYLHPRPGRPSSRELRRVEQLTRCMFSQRRRLAAKVARACGAPSPGWLGGRRVYQLSPREFLELAAHGGGE
jgi:16S rRNA (adenine1518-N6/adenine1519-N6)-dimethyltransferase